MRHIVQWPLRFIVERPKHEMFIHEARYRTILKHFIVAPHFVVACSIFYPS